MLGGTAAAADSEGSIRYVQATSPSFDDYMESKDPAVRGWIQGSMWRMLVYAPYFDDKTSWYGGAWMYQDLYAIYRDKALAQQRPDWVLRDGSGNALYIPWGCSGGTCPQYAGDVGNPAFRQWWIDQARGKLSRGYKGLWIDDVNMDMRVGDGSGKKVAPIDPRTGAPMTDRAWRGYVATFAEEIRAALPGVEIVHNAIWFAAPDRIADADVRRQVRAADYVNLERGVNDDGLTGGNGSWSLRAFLRYVDEVHKLGPAVVFEGEDDSPVGREYSLGAYMLINDGRDAVGLSSVTPGEWWPMFEENLGEALGARYDWQNLQRRDFAGGMALVNEPGAPTRTVTLPKAMVDSTGKTVTSVTLRAATAAVLRGAGSTAPRAPEPTPPVRVELRVEPQPPAPAPAPRAPESGAGAGSGAAGSGSGAGARSTRGGSQSRAKSRKRSRRGSVVVRGRVQHAVGGRVRLQLLRRKGGSVRAVQARVVSVRSGKRFAVKVKGLRPGRYVVRARYERGTAARSGTVARRFALKHR
jgi:hypothetical protein